MRPKAALVLTASPHVKFHNCYIESMHAKGVDHSEFNNTLIGAPQQANDAPVSATTKVAATAGAFVGGMFGLRE